MHCSEADRWRFSVPAWKRYYDLYWTAGFKHTRVWDYEYIVCHLIHSPPDTSTEAGVLPPTHHSLSLEPENLPGLSVKKNGNTTNRSGGILRANTLSSSLLQFTSPVNHFTLARTDTFNLSKWDSQWWEGHETRICCSCQVWTEAYML